MTDLRQLLEKANKNENMQWRVYAFDPEQDNKLVYTSKAFDCICQAQKDKLLQLDKHPNYTVEISTMRVDESAQKNESSEEFAEGLLAAAKILKSKGFSEDKHMQAGLMGSTYRKGSHLISIGLYNGNQVQVDTYDETQGEDTFVKNWNLDRVRMSDIVSATQSALKSLNESSQKNEANLTKVEYLDKMYADLLSFKNNLEGSKTRFKNTELTREQLKRAKEKVTQIEKLLNDIRTYIKMY